MAETEPAHERIVRLREATEDDLELLLAWRNHPRIYVWSYTQEGPLDWEDHYEWWHSREHRTDWVIIVDDGHSSRRVGTVFATNLTRAVPDIGVIVGETTVWGEGIGTTAIDRAAQLLAADGYVGVRARIMAGNLKSRRAFAKAGFELDGPSGRPDEHAYVREFQ